MARPSFSRSRASVLLVALAGLALGACGSAASSAPSPADAKALFESAMKNASQQTWVHETVSEHAEGSSTLAARSLTMNNHVGSAQGVQAINYNGGLATVALVHGDAYIRGDGSALINYFQLVRSDPGPYVNKWIEFTPKDQGFSVISQGVTLKSDFDQFSSDPSEMTKSGHMSEGSVTTRNGVKVIPIHGTLSVPTGKIPLTLYVTASGTPLPIELTADNATVTSTTTWSGWNTPYTLTPPSGALTVKEVK